MDFFNFKKIKKIPNTTFILKNIEPTYIDKEFQLIINDVSSSINYNYTINKDTTSVEKLGISMLKYQPIITIVSREKSKQKLYPVMMDINSSNTLPEKTTIPCFYCRRKYDTSPIGIPIKYTSDKKFETDAMVCSFNCIKSYISEHPSPLYRNTPVLIDQLYYRIFNKYPKEKILPSPSWRHRQEYGGLLTDEEYSKSLQTLVIKDLHQVGDLFYLKNRIYEIEDSKFINN